MFSELRLRRHPNKAPITELHGRERIEQQISRLEAEFDSKRKRDEVKRISRSKSKVYRHVSRQLLQTARESPSPKDGQYPPQSETQRRAVLPPRGGRPEKLRTGQQSNLRTVALPVATYVVYTYSKLHAVADRPSAGDVQRNQGRNRDTNGNVVGQPEKHACRAEEETDEEDEARGQLRL